MLGPARPGAVHLVRGRSDPHHRALAHPDGVGRPARRVPNHRGPSRTGHGSSRRPTGVWPRRRRVAGSWPPR